MSAVPFWYSLLKTLGALGFAHNRSRPPPHHLWWRRKHGSPAVIAWSGSLVFGQSCTQGITDRTEETWALPLSGSYASGETNGWITTPWLACEHGALQVWRSQEQLCREDVAWVNSGRTHPCMDMSLLLPANGYQGLAKLQMLLSALHEAWQTRRPQTSSLFLWKLHTA